MERAVFTIVDAEYDAPLIDTLSGELRNLAGKWQAEAHFSYALRAIKMFLVGG